MSNDSLFVCMTMDVERIGPCSPTGGPPDWAFAARSAQDYCEILDEFGLPATLFVVPDTAVEQGTLLRQIGGQYGAELGMHMHPQCWKDHFENPDDHDYLGGYDEGAQHAMLAEALDQIGDHLGERPRAFRGGNFSANDDTFRVLAALGFTHGSVSQPGRSVPEFRACWRGADPDVHLAHRAFRLVPGDLDFVEVPLTSDRERTDNWTGVGDVRIEGTTPDALAKAVRQEVGRQVGDDVPIKHVCILTHNTVNYGSEDPAEKGKRDILKASLAHMFEIATDLGLTVVGATLADVRKAFLTQKRLVAGV